jgi:hypothetical protein
VQISKKISMLPKTNTYKTKKKCNATSSVLQERKTNKMFRIRQTMYDTDGQLQVGPRNTDLLPGCTMLCFKCMMYDLKVSVSLAECKRI